MSPILEVHHLSKKYSIRHAAGGYLSLREKMLGAFKFGKMQTEDFWAVDNVSFAINPGESVGIIGRNGAGKSTLLKILSRITPPTKGKIITRGRMASLLEVGTGFHPELTGRENIFFNGSLLGMKRREILSKFDEIVDFSGVEKFLDTPLKHYSSGMQLRLAFSVAAFLEPEILVIDEVLAVGDAEFQKKCLGKMEDVTKSGRTILFVSHNMAAVENLCSRGILLNEGTVILDDNISNVTREYQKNLAKNVSGVWTQSLEKDSALNFQSIELELLGNQPQHQLKLRTILKSNSQHPKAFLAFDFTNSLGQTFMQAIPQIDPFIAFSATPQEITTVVDLPALIPDNYYVTTWIGPHYSQTYDILKEIVCFEINQSPTAGRTFPHSHDHGVLVPTSEIKWLKYLENSFETVQS